MPHGNSETIDSQATDKKKVKRNLARHLIQHIMALYDSIIQKIEHGIGILWEEHFSQELYNIAKLRVEHELINDIDQLNAWFQKISANIRDKVTNLSASLLSHFYEIIREEVDFLNPPAVQKVSFGKEMELQQKQDEKQEDPSAQNKQNHSLYETCTESSRGGKKKAAHERLQTVSSQSVCSQDLTQQLAQDQMLHMDTRQYQAQWIQPQMQEKRGLELSSKNKKQTPRRFRKVSYDESDQEQEAEGGFYGVFLGILDAFDM